MVNKYKKSSAWSVVVNLCCVAVGFGCTAIPYIFRCTGLVGGIALCILSAFFIALTIQVIVKNTLKYNSNSYQDMIRSSLGSPYSWFTAILQIVTLFGITVAGWILVGDLFRPLMIQICDSSEKWLTNRRVIIVVIAVVLVLPISIRRSAANFTGASLVALLMILILGVVLIIRGVKHVHQNGVSGTEPIEWRPQIVQAITLFIFAFQAHAEVPTLVFELDEKSSLCWPQLCQDKCEQQTEQRNSNLPSSSQQEESELQEIQNSQQQQKDITDRKTHIMNGAVLVSYIFMALLYCIIGTFGYILWPDIVGSNFVNCLPREEVFIQVLRGLLGLSVVLHYPIIQHVARTVICDLLSRIFRWQLSQNRQSPYIILLIITLLFFVSSVGVSMFVTDLGSVYTLIGGLADAIFIFTFPGLMILGNQLKHSNLKRQPCILENTIKTNDLKNEDLHKEFVRIEQHPCRLENTYKVNNIKSENLHKEFVRIDMKQDNVDSLNRHSFQSQNSSNEQNSVNFQPYVFSFEVEQVFDIQPCQNIQGRQGRKIFRTYCVGIVLVLIGITFFVVTLLGTFIKWPAHLEAGEKCKAS